MIDLLNIASGLKACHIKPLCHDHKPVKNLVNVEGFYMIEIHCPNCNFHGYVHPQEFPDA